MDEACIHFYIRLNGMVLDIHEDTFTLSLIPK